MDTCPHCQSPRRPGREHYFCLTSVSLPHLRGRYCGEWESQSRTTRSVGEMMRQIDRKLVLGRRLQPGAA
ncbi:MAG TPA: hypothetical protein VG796_14415 [Verrucomicrobiales bacterium]|nr:hypothetical protein [Verrucomicrobiales bacterium]